MAKEKATSFTSHLWVACAVPKWYWHRAQWQCHGGYFFMFYIRLFQTQHWLNNIRAHLDHAWVMFPSHLIGRDANKYLWLFNTEMNCTNWRQKPDVSWLGFLSSMKGVLRKHADRVVHIHFCPFNKFPSKVVKKKKCRGVTVLWRLNVWIAMVGFRQD